MNLSLQQQAAIRSKVEKIAISKKYIEELYDHIVSSLESKPVDSKFSMKTVNTILETELNGMVNTNHEIEKFSFWNTIGGGIVFLISLIVYWKTMEPTVSFWDCGEFIAAASKLQVGHQPGAPLFIMIGKIFSLFAIGDTSKITYWVNFSSVLASAATISFLFWTITAIARKIYIREKLAKKMYAILLAGIIGSLSYTFSDTFWFSAVEAEVYALSSLFTAITFWAILKWDYSGNDRWIIFIGFLIGLSIGVHLLSLLTIPAVALIWYFKKSEKITKWGAFKAFLIGCILVGIVQVAVIQYFILFAAKFDLFFVNTIGWRFGSGAIIFILLVAIGFFISIRFSIKKGLYKLNLGLLSMVFLLFGFSSYFMILIRADAKTSINLSNPDNPFALYEYLTRINYGSTPILYGNTFDAKPVSHEDKGARYRKDTDKYVKSGEIYSTTYDKNLVFPRTFSDKPNHVSFYQRWLNLQPGETPTFVQNINFFVTWQVGVMYWRYFFWNFVGRQNDEQGYGGIENGNWLSGIKSLDALRLGNQDNLPPSIIENAGHNVFFGLPLLLGLLGVIWLFKKQARMGWVVMALFLMTGLAIIVYINQDPLQVRERDYAYVGSFYAFAICIGFGFILVKDLFNKFFAERASLITAGFICIVAVPLWMGYQGWDDHDRSNKYTALEWAKNYLDSCEPNAILFTNADNDTYPLWYVQQVENYRTDVRVVNAQFLNEDAYLDQLRKQEGLSAPIAMTTPSHKYVQGVRDYFPYVDYGLKDSVELGDLLEVMISDNKSDQVEMASGEWINFLPTKNIKLSVNTQQLAQSKTLNAEQLKNAAPAIEWEFKKEYATRMDLAIFDILKTNNWERPIYFGAGVSKDTYMGLDKYMYLEGFAYRLLPLQHEGDERDKSQKTNTNKMYAHMLNKMDFSGFKRAKYLDPESRRVLNSTWLVNNTLVENLLMENKKTQAGKILAKNLRELPLKNSSVDDTLNRISTVRNLYAIGDVKNGNDIAIQTLHFLEKEMNYIGTLPENYIMAYRDKIETSMYVLNVLDDVSAFYNQTATNKRLKEAISRIRSHFMES